MPGQVARHVGKIRQPAHGGDPEPVRPFTEPLGYKSGYKRPGYKI